MFIAFEIIFAVISVLLVLLTAGVFLIPKEDRGVLVINKALLTLSFAYLFCSAHFWFLTIKSDHFFLIEGCFLVITGLVIITAGILALVKNHYEHKMLVRKSFDRY